MHVRAMDLDAHLRDCISEASQEVRGTERMLGLELLW